MKINLCIFVTIIVLFFVVVGCNNNPFGVVYVEGIVNVDGLPVEGVMVTFSSTTGNGVTAVGTTDKDGKFVLTTAGAKFGTGIMPGTYALTFAKNEFTASKDEKLIVDYNTPAGEPYTMVELIPSKYNDPTTSGFEPVTVEKKKKNIFKFEIKTK
ncbi:MAG: carboxypeptidase-like regulatory domain-containing protein [Planctomycetaceae bacterium]|jgi:hypothetical protein|nr:carboxypeptidase-like regulatory domain-containing protein [Planctomycetaceae bacterium]